MQSLTLAFAAAMPMLAASAAAMANWRCVGLPGGAGGVGGGHLGLLGAAQHLGTQVLDGLEAADRLAELLAHLGVGDRGLQRPPGDAGRLGGQHGRGQVLDPLGCARSRWPAPTSAPPGPAAGKSRRPAAARLDTPSLAVSTSSHFPSAGNSRTPPAAAPSTHGRVPDARDVSLSNCTSPSSATPAKRSPEVSAPSTSGIGDDQRGQRGGRDRPGHQRLGRLLDHRAQVFDAAAGPAVLLGDGDTEQSQVGQPGEHRPPGVGVALLDVADRRRSPEPEFAGPIAHQLARRELFVGDGRYHV